MTENDRQALLIVDAVFRYLRMEISSEELVGEIDSKSIHLKSSDYLTESDDDNGLSASAEFSYYINRAAKAIANPLFVVD